MSTSLLYHTQGTKDFQFQAFEYSGAVSRRGLCDIGIVFNATGADGGKCMGEKGYLTIARDMQTGAVLHVGKGRGGDALTEFEQRIRRSKSYYHSRGDGLRACLHRVGLTSAPARHACL